MRVSDAMSASVLYVGPNHTLQEAAKLMADRGVGAAIVLDGDTTGIGILTERDVLTAVARGLDPASERVAAHVTNNLVTAAPHWPLDQAAETMVAGGFRHLVVTDSGDVIGVLSVRDIVRVWSDKKQLVRLPM
jgi:CBS domain-containing protein